MLQTLLSITQSALSLWASKEKRKYQDKLIRLQRRYDYESNKPKSKRDDSILDDIEFELMLVSRFVAEEIRRETTKSVPK